MQRTTLTAGGAKGPFSRVIWGVVIDSDSPFTCQINGLNGIAVISGLLAGAECAISAAIAPWCLTACSVTYHRRVCLIDTYTTHFCSLGHCTDQCQTIPSTRRMHAQTRLATVPLKVCTLTTHIVRLRACCFTSATTMDQWSIWWSSCTTSHANCLLNTHLEPQLRLESLEKEPH